jgi:hypothetical protein
MWINYRVNLLALTRRPSPPPLRAMLLYGSVSMVSAVLGALFYVLLNSTLKLK